MKLEFRSSFLKDIKKIRDKETRKLVEGVITDCESAKTISDINHCEPLRSRGKYFK